MACESTNIIYVMWCNKCQIQYVGETVNSLKSRFYQLRSNINKQAGKCTNIIHHCNIINNSLKDLKCMPLEIIRNKSNTVRKKREKHWVRVLATRFRKGLTLIFPRGEGGWMDPPTGNPNISKTAYAINKSFGEFVDKSFAVILH